jgi:hypothetical protein
MAELKPATHAVGDDRLWGQCTDFLRKRTTDLKRFFMEISLEAKIATHTATVHTSTHRFY